MNILTTWSKAQDEIRQKIGENAYQSWFTHLTALSENDSTLIIATPDEFFKNWIVDHYLPLIEDVLKKQIPSGLSIEMRIVPQEDLPRAITPSVTPSTSISQTNGSDASVSKKLRGLHINPRLTFENFVIGSSNQMASLASQAVANSPAKAYNPLFLYGQSGMGKTHLMQAIANHVITSNPSLQCVYLTSEQFTNELITSIQHGKASDFKQKYRGVDVLLIDDIQFIAGKKATQEEFFHTFNAIHDNHKQVVISSDRPPKEISELEDRLVTRFLWGLIVDIQPPDFETRVAILKKKNELESVKVPDEVIYFIAEQIKTNIRELEGALIQVVANSMLQEKPVNLQFAQIILKNVLRDMVKIISIEMVQQVVCDHFHVTINDLKNNKRTQNFVVPRHIAMYLTRHLTQHSLPEIGKAFGGKDHTTVLSACKKVEENINKDNKIKYIVDKLSTLLKQ